jgi:hypothetical protein
MLAVFQVGFGRSPARKKVTILSGLDLPSHDNRKPAAEAHRHETSRGKDDNQDNYIEYQDHFESDVIKEIGKVRKAY